MIKISYIEKGSQEPKRLNVKALFFIDATGEFCLHPDVDGKPFFIEPKFLSALSGEYNGDIIKEEIHGKT